MIEDEAGGLSLDKVLALLVVTFDAATEQAVVLSTVAEEAPEAVRASVMLLDHLVGEESAAFIPDQDLLWLEAGQLLNTLIDVS